MVRQAWSLGVAAEHAKADPPLEPFEEGTSPKTEKVAIETAQLNLLTKLQS